MLLITLSDGINKARQIKAVSCYTWRGFNNENETFLKILDQNDEYITVKISDYVMIHIDAILLTGVDEDGK